MFVAVAWLAGFSSAMASDWVVLDAPSNIAMPQRGDILFNGDTVDLPVGQQIVVIHKDGTLLRISGPYVGEIGKHRERPAAKNMEADLSVLGVISKLLKDNDRLISTLGSTRDPATGIVPTNAFPWQPHVGAAATYCIDPDQPVIRRRNSTNSVRVTLASPDFHVRDQVWLKGQDTLRLELMSKGEPTSYNLLFSDRPGQFTLLVRPDTQSDNRLEQIAWMAQVGCQHQALQLLEQTQQSAR